MKKQKDLYPCFDRLQELIDKGAYIKKQRGEYFIFDADGDRVFFIDEKGSVIPGTMITALVARELLKQYPGEMILFDIRNILTPKTIVEENNGKMGITKVGHAFITEQLNNTGAIFAGEGSAHYFFRETGNAESQMPVILTVLKVMTEEGKPISEIVNDLKRSFESEETNFRVSNAQEIIDAVKEKYNDANLSDLDGITVEYPNWRMNLRTSNTEPLLRLNIKAFDENVMLKNKADIVELIESLKKENISSSH